VNDDYLGADYGDVDPVKAHWEEAMAADPVGAAWSLAQLAASQQPQQPVVDPAAVAAQAAHMLSEVNAASAAAQEEARLASRIDRQLAARFVGQYGPQEHEQTVSRVAQRLEHDEGFAKLNPTDEPGILDYISRTYEDMATEADRREFAKIKAAGPTEYWKSMEYQDALRDVQNRG
jgi:hypothetical protein